MSRRFQPRSMYVYELNQTTPPTILNNSPPDGNRGGGVSGGGKRGRKKLLNDTIRDKQIERLRKQFDEETAKEDLVFEHGRQYLPRPQRRPRGRPRGRPRKVVIPLVQESLNDVEYPLVPYVRPVEEEGDAVQYQMPQSHLKLQYQPQQRRGRQRQPRQPRPLQPRRPIRINKRAGKTMLNITNTLITKLEAYSNLIHTIRTQNEPLFNHVNIINNHILPALQNVRSQMTTELSF